MVLKVRVQPENSQAYSRAAVAEADVQAATFRETGPLEPESPGFSLRPRRLAPPRKPRSKKDPRETKARDRARIPEPKPDSLSPDGHVSKVHSPRATAHSRVRARFLCARDFSTTTRVSYAVIDIGFLLGLKID
ncbi:hypothetical protein PUN28_017806 [Cardiocondyla obscurior]|uniref:Uncharacterized protein n=1 Tax=Cardiocondyla obscurior TaxID=286306 RepID=A0AAW2EN43_9HYME